MADKKVALDQENVFVRIRLLTDSTGVPATGVVAATAGHEIWYHREGAAAPVTDGGSAADMSALDDPHTDWEFLHIREGEYWVAIPDAAFAQGVGSVQIGMNATGITGLTVTVVIEPLFKYHGQAAAVTATTTTFPAGNAPYKGDQIYCSAGTGIGQTRVIESVVGQVATHQAWDTNISDSTSTILLIAGDAYQANMDAAASSLSTLDATNIKAEADSAVQEYFDPKLSARGNLNVNQVEKNNTLVLGTGIPTDKYRGS